MTVDVELLHSFMEDRVRSDVERALTIIVKDQWASAIEMQVTNKINQPL